MRSLPLALLGLGISSGLVLAQGGPIPPGSISGPDALSPIFQQTWLTANTNVYLPTATSKWVAQASSNQLFNNTPGTWSFQLTLWGLDTAYGNVAASPTYEGVVMGTYDQVANTWKPNTLGNNMNTASGGCFGLMLSGDIQGQLASVDLPTGPAVSRRATATQAFPVPTIVSGITNTYVDPSIARWKGKDMLLWVDLYTSGGNNLSRILMQELDMNNYPTAVSLTGPALNVADVTIIGTGTINVHSPTPIMGRDGRIHGLWMSERIGNDSDQYYKADLRVAKGHEQVPVMGVGNSTAWYNNGAIPGGRIIAANSGSTGGFYNGLHTQDCAWMVGDELDINTSGEFIGAMWDTNSGANVTAVFLSAGYLPVAGGVAIPGIKGKFGLDLATLVPFGTMAHADATQRASMPIAIPNDPGLKGKSFNLQGLSIDPGAPTVQAFTNTAWININ